MIKYLFLILTLILSVNLQAQDTMRFTLNEAINHALKNNLQRKSSQLNVDDAQARVGELTAIGLPQVKASVNIQHWIKLPTSLFPLAEPAVFTLDGENYIQGNKLEFNDKNQLVPVFGEPAEIEFGAKNNITPAFELNQLLFSGSYLYGLKGARQYVELTKMQHEATSESITDNVVQTYLGCLIAKENIDILDKNIENLSKIEFEMSQLLENGFLEEIELDRITLSLNNLKARKTNTQRNLDIAKEYLKLAMGFYKETPVELTTSLQNILDEQINYQDINDVYKQRKQYQILNLQEELNETDVKRLKAGYYPSLSFYATHQWQYQADNFKIFKNKWFPATAIGLYLDIPIFDGLQKKYTIQQRQINKDRISVNKDLLRYNYQKEFENAKKSYIIALDELKTQQNSIKLAEKIYDTALIKYNEGLGSSLEVTDAESKLFETQALLVQAMYNVVNAKSALQKSMGKY